MKNHSSDPKLLPENGEELSLMSHFRLTGHGVSDKNIPVPEQKEQSINKEELAKAIARHNGHKVRSGYTNKKASKTEIRQKRKTERARKKKARN